MVWRGDRDPEQARPQLGPVLECMMDVVHRYEGTTNQVLGDGMMVWFGASIVHEDHAMHACYAALAMQASVKQYAEDVQRTRGVPLHSRVGFNTGAVVVRAIGVICTCTVQRWGKRRISQRVWSSWPC
jgi:class 3 adenylate cyclase